jgi:delta1-piperideine-2-carboxylate reductase
MMADPNSPPRSLTDETHLLGFDALSALLERAFLRAGASDTVARILAANCAACERDGSLSHGIFRMPGYLSSIASGWVDPSAVPRIDDVGPAMLRVDAMNGFAQPALLAARPLLLEKVAAAGSAVIAIRNSHHFSALWPDVEPFANEGLVAISAVNSFACTVPHGARSAVFGTNPIAYAAPRLGGHPLVADLATSSMANGDVQLAAREGRPLPPGHAVDGEGQPTNDADTVLESGALLTFGGHKGSAISLMIELLGAALTGGQFSFEVDWSAYPGAQTPHTGQFIIVIDPDRGRTKQFAARTETLVERLFGAGLSRLPGTRRYERREETARTGIPLQPLDLARLEQMARDGTWQ